MANADYAATSNTGRTSIDRGLVDAVATRQTLTGDEVLHPLCTTHRCPPAWSWSHPGPRSMSRRRPLPCFDDAVAKYQRLTAIYPALGCDVVLLPKFPPQHGHDFVLIALAERCGQDMTVGR